MATNPLSGAVSYLLVQKEDSYGQKPDGFPSGEAQYLNFISENLDDRRENVASPRLTFGFVHWTRVYRSARRVEGTIEIELPYAGAEVLLEAAWGSRSESRENPSQSPEVYDHLYTSTTVLPSLFMEIGFDTKVMRLYGMMISQLGLASSNTGFIKASFSFLGQKAEIVNAPNPIRDVVLYDHYPVGEEHEGFSMLWYTRGPGTNPPTGVYSPTFSSFSVSIDNRLGANYPLGSDLIKKPRRSGYRKVTGRLIGEFNDNQFDAFELYSTAQKALWYQYVVGNTITPVNAGGNDANLSYQVDYRGNKIDLRGATPKITGHGTTILDVPFEGFWDVTESVDLLYANDEPFIFRTRNNLDADLQLPTPV